MAKKKNPAAVALGRLGAKARVPKGAAMLSPEERRANAQIAAKARWSKRESKAKRPNSEG
jgi:hypothetical protein